MRTIRASARWPAEGERFEDGWAQAASAHHLVAVLADGLPAGGRAESLVGETLREVRRAAAADVLALLTLADQPPASATAGAPLMLRLAVAADAAPAEPAPLTVAAGDPTAAVVARALPVAADVAIEVPLPAAAGDPQPVGCLLAFFAGDDADARAARAVAILEHVAWAFTLAVRGGWQAMIDARRAGADWPALGDAERAVCRAARERFASDTDATGSRLDETVDDVLEHTRPAEPAPSPPDEEPAPRTVDENVQFTVYRPRRIPPERWCPILAFAHLAERRPGAAAGDPDPVEEVRRQARQVLGEQAAAYADSTQDSGEAIPREGEITFVLDLPDLLVNPGQRSFRWLEDVHREEFRVRAPAILDGRTVRGALHVYLGALLVAEVTLAIRVDAAATRPVASDTEADGARPYRRIFPSYSHRDEAIVQQVEAYARTMGDEYLRDVTHLRAGERWNERLMDFIRGADVFQLFWSRHSMVSRYVRQEWEYALSLGRPHFVRPTYWETPMPEAPERDLPPRTLKALHFQRLPVRAEATADAAVAPPAAPAPPPPAAAAPAGPPAAAPAPAEPPAAAPSPPPRPGRPLPRPASRWRLRRVHTALAALLFVGFVGGTLVFQQGHRGGTDAPPSAGGGAPKPEVARLRAVSPDGALVASMDDEGRIRVASQDGSGAAPVVIATRFRPADIEALRFSPDGRRIVCALRDGSTVEWDARTGTRVV